MFARPQHSLTRDSYIRVLSAKSCWLMRLEADYGMGPRVQQSLDGPSFRLSSKLCLCNSFHGCFVPNSKKGQSVLHAFATGQERRNKLESSAAKALLLISSGARAQESKSSIAYIFRSQSAREQESKSKRARERMMKPRPF